MSTLKKDIRALSKDQLMSFFSENGDQAFRGKQVYEWLWKKGVHKFEDMTNLSKDTRQLLEHAPAYLGLGPCGCSNECYPPFFHKFSELRS